ncbi:MAG TPA: ABC transporter permease [Gaiellaceae bacterium]|nr:ABC transporter permease [Gaiellaceae bacterium]
MIESATTRTFWPRARRRSPGIAGVARVELVKLTAQAPARVAAAVCLLGPFAFVAVLAAQPAVPADTLFGRWVHQTGFAIPLVILGFAGSWGFPVLAGLLAGDLFAAEDRHDTWKTALTRSRSRFELFAGKTLAAAVLTIWLALGLAVASIVAGLAGSGAKPLVDLSGTVISPGRALQLCAESFALVLAPLLAFTALALLLSVVSRSGVLGVLGAALAGLVMQVLALVGSGAALRTVLPSSGFDAWHGLFAAPEALRPVEQSILVAAAWATVCTGAAWFVFRRRDFAGSAPVARRSRLARGRSVIALAAGVALVAAAAGWGPPAVTASRLDAAIGPEFEHLVTLQQRELGHGLAAGARLKLLSTCRRRGATTPYRGPGDWFCTLTAVAANLRQMPLNYDVDVRPDGCFTAHGPPAVGGALLRGHRAAGTPNPLYAFDGCFET